MPKEIAHFHTDKFKLCPMNMDVTLLLIYNERMDRVTDGHTGAMLTAWCQFMAVGIKT